MLVLENKQSHANSATSLTILQISVSTIPNLNLSTGRNPTMKANSTPNHKTSAGTAGKLDIKLTAADQGQTAQPVERAAILPQFA